MTVFWIILCFALKGQRLKVFNAEARDREDTFLMAWISNPDMLI